MGNIDGNDKILWQSKRSPKKDLATAVRSFRAPEEGTVRRMCGGAAANHLGHFALLRIVLQDALVSGSKWRCFPLRIVLQDALNEVKEITFR